VSGCMEIIKKRYPKTILATVCIPWTENYELDEKNFARNIEILLQNKIKHIYLFGTAGEGYAVNNDKFQNIVEKFSYNMMKSPNTYQMVGIISLSMFEIMERIKIAYSYGIKEFQISIPSWQALSDNEIFDFFHNICSTYSDCNFVYYNIIRNKRLLSFNELNKLSVEIPNLVGVKYPSYDLRIIYEFATKLSPLQFFTIEESFGYASLFGECGLLLTIGNINLAKSHAFFDAANRKDKDEIINFVKNFVEIRRILKTITGQGKIDGAYDKIYSKLINPEFPLRLIPPYEYYTDDIFKKFKETLVEEFPDWIKI
jgi:dihydrodipicolinate synthase/N-acetylneuraminate lyase